METRRFDKNPLAGPIIRIAVFGGAFCATGALLIVFGGESLMLTGVAVIAGAVILETLAVLRAIRAVACPRCGQTMTRDRNEGSFACRLCDIKWELPQHRPGGGGA